MPPAWTTSSSVFSNYDGSMLRNYSRRRGSGSGSSDIYGSYPTDEIIGTEAVAERVDSNERDAQNLLNNYGDKLNDDDKNWLEGIVDGFKSSVPAVFEFLSRPVSAATMFVEQSLPSGMISTGLLGIGGIPLQLLNSEFGAEDLTKTPEELAIERGETEGITSSDYWNLLVKGDRGAVVESLGTTLAGYEGSLLGTNLLESAGVTTGEGMLGDLPDSWAKTVAKVPLGLYRFGGAFSWDIAFDPLTYTSFGTGGMGRNVAQKTISTAVTKAGKAVRTRMVDAGESILKKGGGIELTNSLERKVYKEAVAKIGARKWDEGIGWQHKVDEVFDLRRTLEAQPKKGPNATVLDELEGDEWYFGPKSFVDEGRGELVYGIEQRTYGRGAKPGSWWHAAQEAAKEGVVPLWTTGGFRIGPPAMNKLQRGAQVTIPGTRGVFRPTVRKISNPIRSAMQKTGLSDSPTLKFMDRLYQKTRTRFKMEEPLRQQARLLDDGKFAPYYGMTENIDKAALRVTRYIEEVSRHHNVALAFSEIETAVRELPNLNTGQRNELIDSVMQAVMGGRKVGDQKPAWATPEIVQLADDLTEQLGEQMTAIAEVLAKVDPDLAQALTRSKNFRPFIETEEFAKAMDRFAGLWYDKLAEGGVDFNSQAGREAWTKALSEISVRNGKDPIETSQTQWFIDLVEAHKNRPKQVHAVGVADEFRYRRIGRTTFLQEDPVTGIAEEAVGFHPLDEIDRGLSNILEAAIEYYDLGIKFKRSVELPKAKGGKAITETALELHPGRMFARYTQDIMDAIRDRTYLAEAVRAGRARQAKAVVDEGKYRALIVENGWMQGIRKLYRDASKVIDADLERVIRDETPVKMQVGDVGEIEVPGSMSRQPETIDMLDELGEIYGKAKAVRTEFPEAFNENVERLVSAGEPRAAAESAVAESVATAEKQARETFIAYVRTAMSGIYDQVSETQAARGFSPQEAAASGRRAASQQARALAKQFDEFEKAFSPRTQAAAMGWDVLDSDKNGKLVKAAAEATAEGMGETQTKKAGKAARRAAETTDPKVQLRAAQEEETAKELARVVNEAIDEGDAGRVYPPWDGEVLRSVGLGDSTLSVDDVINRSDTIIAQFHPTWAESNKEPLKSTVRGILRAMGVTKDVAKVKMDWKWWHLNMTEVTAGRGIFIPTRAGAKNLIVVTTDAADVSVLRSLVGPQARTVGIIGPPTIVHGAQETVAEASEVMAREVGTQVRGEKLDSVVARLPGISRDELKAANRQNLHWWSEVQPGRLERIEEALETGTGTPQIDLPGASQIDFPSPQVRTQQIPGPVPEIELAKEVARLEKMTIPQLRELVTKRKITGLPKKLRKQQLIQRMADEWAAKYHAPPHASVEQAPRPRGAARPLRSKYPQGAEYDQLFRDEMRVWRMNRREGLQRQAQEAGSWQKVMYPYLQMDPATLRGLDEEATGFLSGSTIEAAMREDADDLIATAGEEAAVAHYAEQLAATVADEAAELTVGNLRGHMEAWGEAFGFDRTQMEILVDDWVEIHWDELSPTFQESYRVQHPDGMAVAKDIVERKGRAADDLEWQSGWGRVVAGFSDRNEGVPYSDYAATIEVQARSSKAKQTMFSDAGDRLLEHGPPKSRVQGSRLPKGPSPKEREAFSRKLGKTSQAQAEDVKSLDFEFFEAGTPIRIPERRYNPRRMKTAQGAEKPRQLTRPLDVEEAPHTLMELEEGKLPEAVWDPKPQRRIIAQLSDAERGAFQRSGLDDEQIKEVLQLQYEDELREWQRAGQSRLERLKGTKAATPKAGQEETFLTPGEILEQEARSTYDEARPGYPELREPVSAQLPETPKQAQALYGQKLGKLQELRQPIYEMTADDYVNLHQAIERGVRVPVTVPDSVAQLAARHTADRLAPTMAAFKPLLDAPPFRRAMAREGVSWRVVQGIFQEFERTKDLSLLRESIEFKKFLALGYEASDPTPVARAAADPLEKKTVKELRRLASVQGIAGRSKMRKAELVKALSDATGDVTEQRPILPPEPIVPPPKVASRTVFGKAGGVNVGRPGSGGVLGPRSGRHFGNPFKAAPGKGTEEVVESYRIWLDAMVEGSPEFRQDVMDLAGETLRCPSRSPHSPCHAEVLARKADELVAESQEPPSPTTATPPSDSAGPPPPSLAETLVDREAADFTDIPPIPATEDPQAMMAELLGMQKDKAARKRIQDLRDSGGPEALRQELEAWHVLSEEPRLKAVLEAPQQAPSSGQLKRGAEPPKMTLFQGTHIKPFSQALKELVQQPVDGNYGHFFPLESITQADRPGLAPGSGVFLDYMRYAVSDPARVGVVVVSPTDAPITLVEALDQGLELVDATTWFRRQKLPIAMDPAGTAAEWQSRRLHDAYETAGLVRRRENLRAGLLEAGYDPDVGTARPSAGDLPPLDIDQTLPSMLDENLLTDIPIRGPAQQPPAVPSAAAPASAATTPGFAVGPEQAATHGVSGLQDGPDSWFAEVFREMDMPLEAHVAGKDYDRLSKQWGDAVVAPDARATAGSYAQQLARRTMRNVDAADVTVVVSPPLKKGARSIGTPKTIGYALEGSWPSGKPISYADRFVETAEGSNVWVRRDGQTNVVVLTGPPSQQGIEVLRTQLSGIVNGAGPRPKFIADVEEVKRWVQDTLRKTLPGYPEPPASIAIDQSPGLPYDVMRTRLDQVDAYFDQVAAGGTAEMDQADQFVARLDRLEPSVMDLLKVRLGDLNANPGDAAKMTEWERWWSENFETLQELTKATYGPERELVVKRSGGKVLVVVESPGAEQAARAEAGQGYVELVQAVRSGAISEAEALSRGLDTVVAGAKIRKHLERLGVRTPEESLSVEQGIPGPPPDAAAENVALFDELMGHVDDAILNGNAKKLRNWVGVGEDGSYGTPKFKQLDQSLEAIPEHRLLMHRMLETALLADTPWAKNEPEAFLKWWMSERRMLSSADESWEALAARMARILDAAKPPEVIQRGFRDVAEAEETQKKFKELFDELVGFVVPMRGDQGNAIPENLLVDEGKRFYRFTNLEEAANLSTRQRLENVAELIKRRIQNDPGLQRQLELLPPNEKGVPWLQQLQEAADLAEEMAKDQSKMVQTPVAHGLESSEALGLGGGVLAGWHIDPNLAPYFERSLNNLDQIYTPYGLREISNASNSLVNWWKRWATVMRFNFHPRNAIGAYVNGMFGGVYINDYKEWMPQVMNLRKGLKDLQRGIYNKEAMAASGASAFDVVALRHVDKRYHAAFKEAWNRGILQTGFSRTEGLNLVLGTRSNWNPFSSNFRLAKAGGAVMEGMEDVFRMTMFGKYYMQGAGDFGADLVNLLHFNYTDLTAFEQKIKKFVPFYVWTRRNVPLQLKILAQAPGYLLAIERTRQNWNEQQWQTHEDLYDPLSDNSGWTIPWVRREDDDGWAQLMWRPDLPVNDMLNLPIWGSGDRIQPMGAFNVRDIAQSAVDLLGPQYSLPLDLLESGSGSVNAPRGIAEVMQVFNAMEDATGVTDLIHTGHDADGNPTDVRWPKIVDSLFHSLATPWQDYGAALGFKPRNPSRAADEGWLNSDDPWFIDPRTTIGLGGMRAVARGFGLYWDNPKGQYFESVEDRKRLDSIRFGLKTGES